MRKGAKAEPVTNWHRAGAILLGVLAGYVVGGAVMETADMFYSTPVTPKGGASSGVKIMADGSPTTSAATKTADTRPAGDTIHSVITGNGSPYQNFQGRIMGKAAAAGLAKQTEGDTIHSVFTCGGDGYQNFQSRIMYGTYKLVQKMPGGEKLTGFTRILHRMKPDEFMDEIPTFRANPLHPKCDEWCDFPVADRPNAVAQWIAAAAKDPSMIKGAWILLLECDYVWMRPVQAPDAYDSKTVGLQFMFDYIMPSHPDAAPLMRKLSDNKVDPSVIPRSGPAPVLIRYTDLAGVVPEWERVTAAIEADPVAVKVLDWVREMYAWDVALALRNVTLTTESPPHSHLIAQPPHDLVIGDAAMLHYTWGTLYFEGKTEIWRWEKRDYTSRDVALKVPMLKEPPQPWKEGWRIQDGLPVTRDLHETMTKMLKQMNAAIATLPDLRNRPHA